MSDLEKLGYRPDDRVVVIHIDDLGMCEATVSAWLDLADAGAISSASVMVGAPWFPAVAKICRERPELDVGVHAMLTSEWQAYRWRPISTCDPASGLLDAEGFLPSNRQELFARAGGAAVRREIRVQVEQAQRAGLGASHLDTHMFTAMHSRYLPAYYEAATDHGLVPVICRREGRPEPWSDPAGEAAGREMLTAWRRSGLLNPDDFAIPDLSAGPDELTAACRAFDTLKPGLTHCLIHPARDTPELRAIAPDWPTRVRVYRTFMDSRLRQHIASAGIQVTDYRALQRAMYPDD
ncbi:MAG: ChbG/HpnK family deacetylase [Acidobacteriota bacterium]